MRKFSAFFSIISALVCNLIGLEFGGMGNVSAGMGGAGVALQSSPYGIYYNPALITADNKTKIGYSIGVQYRQHNIDKIADINLLDLNNPNDIESLGNILQDSFLSLTSQNGLVLNLSWATIREEFGSIALAYFGSLYADVTFNADPNHLATIIQDGSNYYQISPVSGGGYSYTPTSEQDYKDHSLAYAVDQGDIHKIITTTFYLSEIPIGYAKTFYFKNSNLNLGIAAKFMNGISATDSIFLSNQLNTRSELKQLTAKGNYSTYSTFGVDLGAMYQVDFPNFRYLSFGIVAKNINYPTFKYDWGNIVIKPQYRVGIAYNEQYFTVAIDADILPNDILNFDYQKQQSQMIGGGVKFDLKYVDLRAGAMKDIRQNDGLILTAGINVLGLFDISVQSGTKIGQTKDYKIPEYLNIKLGGSVSF